MPENIDLRNSPSIYLSKYLFKNKINSNFFDVMSNQIIKNKLHVKEKFISENQILKYKLIVVSNNNFKYRDIFLNQISKKNLNKEKRIIFDCWNMLDKNVCESSGFEYHNI